jgi:hypothetical protein
MSLAQVEVKVTSKQKAPEIDSPTLKVMGELEHAFDYFNKKLFEGKLPKVIFLLHRKQKAYGYFWKGRWAPVAAKDIDKDSKDIRHEIALNPDHVRDRTLEQNLSTVVHEQAHLWKAVFGEKETKTHHDKEWAAKMEDIGLMPSSTGQPGGKRTGRLVSHYIIDDGPFKKHCDAIIKTGFTLSMSSWPAPRTGGRSRVKKVTYTCPECNIKARGKEDINLNCGDCDIPMGC